MAGEIDAVAAVALGAVELLIGAAQRFRILIRRRDDVTTRHQLVDGDTVYRVVAARLSVDWRFLEIDAEVRED